MPDKEPDQATMMQRARESKCPVCGETDPHYGNLEFDCDPSQPGECDACGAEWHEVYAMLCIEIKETP